MSDARRDRGDRDDHGNRGDHGTVGEGRHTRDVLLAGGRIIDPSTRVDEVGDVLLRDVVGLMRNVCRLGGQQVTIPCR